MTPRLTMLQAACLAAAAAPALAQGGATGGALAARAAAADGQAVVAFAARSGACGDGREFLAFGERLQINGGYGWSTGRGWLRSACQPGPVRVTLTVDGGAVRALRVRVGPPAAAPGARDLGTVDAGEAAAYFLGLAGRLTGEAGERAVVAAALADGPPVWRPLVAVARAQADGRVARAAMHWAGATGSGDAVPTVAARLADGAERRPVREGAAAALAFVPDGAGVPALAAIAGGVPSAGGRDAWARDKAVFWLGTARDARARTTLRTLAAADTAPEAVRAQAIFTLGHVDRDEDGDAGNGAFLRALYPRLATERLRERVIQSVAQSDDAAGRRWLVGLATNAEEPLEARKKALFWAGQAHGAPIDDLLAADARLTGAELRRHYTFVLSQRAEDAAVDRLVAIARTDADGAVRRQAIFWLGQSRNPRARRYLEDVVTR